MCPIKSCQPNGCRLSQRDDGILTLRYRFKTMEMSALPCPCLVPLHPLFNNSLRNPAHSVWSHEREQYSYAGLWRKNCKMLKLHLYETDILSVLQSLKWNLSYDYFKTLVNRLPLVFVKFRPRSFSYVS